MPLQNRVTPAGEIVADPSRGLMMGNRGCLHGPGRELGVSRWRSKLWICCVLNWKDVRRDPMPPGRWTALFFLDEATALAAGHRPCAYCPARRLSRLRGGVAGGPRPFTFFAGGRDGLDPASRARQPGPASDHPPGTSGRAARWCHDPGWRRRRAAHQWPAKTLVISRLRRRGRSRRARPGRATDTALDRRRDHRRLPAAGTPDRAGQPPSHGPARRRTRPAADHRNWPATNGRRRCGCRAAASRRR